MLAPIQSIKHYVQFASATITEGTVGLRELVEAVSVAAVGAATDEVEEGSVVKAVFVELWLSANGTSGQTSQFTLIVEKIPAGQDSATFTQMNNLGAYPNKKNILYTTHGILGSAVNGPTVPLIRNWVLIPKGKQRMGLGDVLAMTIAAGAEPMQNCGFTTYKEYK